MPFTHSTYTFALEWVQEVAAHFAVVSRRSRRVVHAPHIIRRALEREREREGAMKSSTLKKMFYFTGRLQTRSLTFGNPSISPDPAGGTKEKQFYDKPN